MFFASDNAGPAHPKVMEALTAANDGYASGYGADAGMGRVREMVRDVFEAPEAAVYLVATGTAANVLTLATLANPWETIFCSPMAHIHEDECNAPEFYTGGAKLTLVPTTDGRMTPEALRTAIEGEGTRGVHGPKPGPVSITNVTERGTRYTSAEIAALAAVAHEHGLPVHLDGARFANALVAEGCSPAEMTWKAGVDVVSFGGTKNGLMGVEAVVLFDPARALEFEYRRKRGGHLFSKHRYLTAQMEAYLAGDLWLDLAKRANAANARLTRALGQMPEVSFLWDPDANMTFAAWPAAAHRRLMAAGARYHLWEGQLDGADDDARIGARLVCDWSMSDENVDRFVEILRS